MIDALAFDADDTLWHNEILYLGARERLVQLLARYQSSARVGRRLDEIEIGNILDYGYGIKSFTLSMIETAIDVTGGQIDGWDVQRVLDVARQMHRAEVQLFEGAEETLEKVAGRYTLMLITKGDSFEQERKIRRSGLVGYFRYVEVVGEKSYESYQAVLRKHEIDPQRFVMVGNSMRSDVLPVLALGGMAVYVPSTHAWFHEAAEELPIRDGRYWELEDLRQLPALLRELD